MLARREGSRSRDGRRAMRAASSSKIARSIIGEALAKSVLAAARRISWAAT
jgi:hypothetical protein